MCATAHDAETSRRSPTALLHFIFNLLCFALLLGREGLMTDVGTFSGDSESRTCQGSHFLDPHFWTRTPKNAQKTPKTPQNARFLAFVFSCQLSHLRLRLERQHAAVPPTRGLGSARGGVRQDSVSRLPVYPLLESVHGSAVQDITGISGGRRHPGDLPVLWYCVLVKRAGRMSSARTHEYPCLLCRSSTGMDL
jgi:hypothetical protein